MTRKDYRVIANAVVEIHNKLHIHAALEAQYILSQYLRTNYSNFDSIKFKEYIEKNTPNEVQA